MLQKHSVLWKGRKMISNPVLRRLLKVFLPLSAITVLLLIFGSVVKAGSLNPSASPAATSYTLGDIYLRLTTNATATEANHLFAPGASPASSLYTLNQIYEKIPTIDATKVKLNTSYLGVDGALTPDGGTAVANDLFNGKTANLTADWDLDTGTLNLACNTATFNGTLNLVSNIYDGAGDGNNRWCITDSGDAISTNILSGKIAWVDGVAVTGAMANIGAQMITPSIANQAITQGYHNGSGYCAGDTDLIATNIRSGVNLFGIDGNGNVVNTASGDAVASDILSGKKAWVDGAEVTGSIVTRTLSAVSETVSAGYYSATTLSAVDSDLSAGNIKNGVNIFGVNGSLVYSGYPGTNWIANGSGDGSTALNQANCEAAYSSGNYRWQWFEDTNGDGDTTDAEDGMCLLMCTGAGCTNSANYSNDGYLSASWNGAEQMSVSLAVQTATDGSASTVVKSGAGWTADAYKNSIAKITSGAANGCWGLVRTNSTDTITVYGSWLTTAYAACGANPGNTDTFQIYQDNMYDNSWIGDWTCSGNFPTGAVVWGSYPTTAQVGANLIALATSDCLDGKRDLLPNESDRAVITGTATAGTSGTTIEDTTLALDANTWMGQKIKITSGANSGSTGIVESNITNALTVLSWSAGAPSAGDTYQVIYVTPFASYQPNTSVCGSTSCIKHNKGPLTTGNLNDWQGTRLPTSMDFFGICGNGSAKKIIGNYGSQNGRTDEYLNEANDAVYEWLSEPYSHLSARTAGVNACSVIGGDYVLSSNRFRAVFRP